METLLKEGAYSALLEDKEGEERARVFCESDINDLLEKQSRVITYDKPNAAVLFNKTSFVSSHADAQLDIKDPMFWKKIYGQDSRETVLDRLEDGRATQDEAAKAAYLAELKELSEEVITQKLSGENVPEWYPLLHTALQQVAQMEAQFTPEQRQEASYLLAEVQRPSRKRKQTTSTIIPDDAPSAADPDYSTRIKDELADEVCCKCFRDYYLIRCTGPCRRCFHLECTPSRSRGGE